MTGMTMNEGPSAWVGRDVRPEDYRVELSAACHDEIRRAVGELRAFPLPTIGAIMESGRPSLLSEAVLFPLS